MDRQAVIDILEQMGACDPSITHVKQTESLETAWLESLVSWKLWLIFRIDTSAEKLGLLADILQRIEHLMQDESSKAVISALRDAEQASAVDWEQIQNAAVVAYATISAAYDTAAVYAAVAAVYAADAAPDAVYAAVAAADATDATDATAERKVQNEIILAKYPLAKVLDLLEEYKSTLS